MNLPHNYWQTLPLYKPGKWASARKRIHREFLSHDVGDMVSLCHMPLHEMDRDLLLEASYILAAMVANKW